jgi:hypothetical protein
LGFVWLIALLNAWSSAAIDPVSPGARSQGMADARVMLTGQGAGMGNPAGLAALTGYSFSMHYANYFLVPELGSEAFSIGMPSMTGTLGIDYAGTGNSFYHESQLCLSYGRTFGQKFRAGIGLHYLMVRQPDGFGNLSVVTPSLGFQALPLTGLTIGFQLFNPAGQNYGPEGYLQLPVIIQTGLGYKLGNEVLVCFEVEKKSDERIKYCGGIEIDLQKSLVARFGISSGVFPGYSFGLGFHLRSLMIDLAASHHPVLGFSPAVTISFAKETGKKKIHKPKRQSFI